MATMYQRIMDYRVGNRKTMSPEGARKDGPVYRTQEAIQKGLYPNERKSTIIDARTMEGRAAGGVQPNADVLAALAAEQDRKKQEERRPKGRASTLATGGTGLLAPASVGRRSLIGF